MSRWVGVNILQHKTGIYTLCPMTVRPAITLAMLKDAAVIGDAPEIMEKLFADLRTLGDVLANKLDLCRIFSCTGCTIDVDAESVRFYTDAQRSMNWYLRKGVVYCHWGEGEVEYHCANSLCEFFTRWYYENQLWLKHARPCARWSDAKGTRLSKGNLRFPHPPSLLV
jgi:hypothetical protein